MNPILNDIHDAKLKEEVARLKEQVKYWQEAYRQAQEEIDKLSLDLGIQDRVFYKKGESND